MNIQIVEQKLNSADGFFHETHSFEQGVQELSQVQLCVTRYFRQVKNRLFPSRLRASLLKVTSLKEKERWSTVSGRIQELALQCLRSREGRLSSADQQTLSSLVLDSSCDCTDARVWERIGHELYVVDSRTASFQAYAKAVRLPGCTLKALFYYVLLAAECSSKKDIIFGLEKLERYTKEEFCQNIFFALSCIQTLIQRGYPLEGISIVQRLTELNCCEDEYIQCVLDVYISLARSFSSDWVTANFWPSIESLSKFAREISNKEKHEYVFRAIDHICSSYEKAFEVLIWFSKQGPYQTQTLINFFEALYRRGESLSHEIEMLKEKQKSFCIEAHALSSVDSTTFQRLRGTYSECMHQFFGCGVMNPMKNVGLLAYLSCWSNFLQYVHDQMGGNGIHGQVACLVDATLAKFTQIRQQAHLACTNSIQLESISVTFRECFERVSSIYFSTHGEESGDEISLATWTLRKNLFDFIGEYFVPREEQEDVTSYLAKHGLEREALFRSTLMSFVRPDTRADASWRQELQAFFDRSHIRTLEDLVAHLS